jgi:preprotein translocase subunit SecF
MAVTVPGGAIKQAKDAGFPAQTASTATRARCPNLLALMVMVHTTPIIFTLFMFIGQPLFVLAFVLLVGAVIADLKARQLL